MLKFSKSDRKDVNGIDSLSYHSKGADSRRYTIYRKVSDEPESSPPSPPSRGKVRRTRSLGERVTIPSQNEYSALIRRAWTNEKLKRLVPSTGTKNESVRQNYRNAFKKEFQHFKDTHRGLIEEEFPSQTRYHETFNNIFHDKRTCFAVGRPTRRSKNSTSATPPIEVNKISPIDVHENFSPPLTPQERRDLGIELFFPGGDPRKVYKSGRQQSENNSTPIGFRGYKSASEGRASKYVKYPRLVRPSRSFIDVRLFDEPDAASKENVAICSKRTEDVNKKKSSQQSFFPYNVDNIDGCSMFIYSRREHSQSVGNIDKITHFYGNGQRLQPSKSSNPEGNTTRRSEETTNDCCRNPPHVSLPRGHPKAPTHDDNGNPKLMAKNRTSRQQKETESKPKGLSDADNLLKYTTADDTANISPIIPQEQAPSLDNTKKRKPMLSEVDDSKISVKNDIFQEKTHSDDRNNGKIITNAKRSDNKDKKESLETTQEEQSKMTSPGCTDIVKSEEDGDQCDKEESIDNGGDTLLDSHQEKQSRPATPGNNSHLSSPNNESAQKRWKPTPRESKDRRKSNDVRNGVSEGRTKKAHGTGNRHKHSKSIPISNDGKQSTPNGSPRKRRHKHSKPADKSSSIGSSHKTKHSHGRSHCSKIHISCLKTTLLVKIFSYLSTRDICRISQVCQKWNNLYLSPELWHSITISQYKGNNIDDIIEMLLDRLTSAHTYGCIQMQFIRLNRSVHLTDKGMLNISMRCPGLKSLEIVDCQKVTGQGLGAILAHCPNMAHLDLTGCEGLTDFDFSSNYGISFGKHASFLELRFLDLSECLLLTDNSLRLILNCATDLQCLYLRRCDSISNSGIEGVAMYCVKLKEISLNDCCNIVDACINTLVSSCLELRYISLAKCAITDESMKSIAKYTKNLRHLNLHECEAVTDEGIRMLSESNHNLRSLDIGKCMKITCLSILSLSNCKNLRRLNVKGCRKIDDTGMKQFANHCSRLRHLNISECAVTLETVNSMKRRMKSCKIIYNKVSL